MCSSAVHYTYGYTVCSGAETLPSKATAVGYNRLPPKFPALGYFPHRMTVKASLNPTAKAPSSRQLYLTAMDPDGSKRVRS